MACTYVKQSHPSIQNSTSNEGIQYTVSSDYNSCGKYSYFTQSLLFYIHWVLMPQVHDHNYPNYVLIIETSCIHSLNYLWYTKHKVGCLNEVRFELQSCTLYTIMNEYYIYCLQQDSSFPVKLK